MLTKEVLKPALLLACLGGLMLSCLLMPRRCDDYTEHHPQPVAVVASQSPRSSQWPAVRRRFLVTHPTCAACGTSQDLNVHHVQPFRLKPELELDPANLITLCRKHHLELGHSGNWRKDNPHVREDAAERLKSLTK